MDPTEGNLTSLLPFWAQTAFLFLEFSYYLKREHTYRFLPLKHSTSEQTLIFILMNLKMHCWAVRSPLQPLVIIIEVLPLQQWIMALQPVLREGTPQKVQSSPAPCLFQKRQSWWGHWLHPQHFSIRVLGTQNLLYLWLALLHLDWQFTHHYPLHTHLHCGNFVIRN